MQPLEIDDTALRRWHEQGWLSLGRILDDATVAALIREEARFRLPVGYGRPENQTLRVNVQLCHRSAIVRRVCTEGPQIAAVARLLGPNVCLTHQQFVTKLPDAPGDHSDIPFHQDDGYGRLDPPHDVTVWIALVDTDERNGCLWILPGSHRLGLLAHDAAGVNPLLREVRLEGQAVPVPMRAGEAVAFTGLTVHGSGPNRSGQERPSFFVRYCDPAVRMASEGGRPVLEDPHSWMVAGEVPGPP